MDNKVIKKEYVNSNEFCLFRYLFAAIIDLHVNLSIPSITFT